MNTQRPNENTLPEEPKTSIEATGSAERIDTYGSSPLDLASKMTKQDLMRTFEGSESKFDEKFKKSISTVESQEVGTINKIDISPEEEKPKATIFLAPGWLEPIATNKFFIRALVGFGYRVISLEHPRKGGTKKSAEARHLEAISAVVNSTDLHGEKMFGLATSLGAIDIAQYADPKRNPDNHGKFKDFVLLNPAGLNIKSKNSKLKDVIRLLKNYVSGHMKQGEEFQKTMTELGDSATVASADKYKGIPLTAITESVRKKANKPGDDDLKANPMLTLLEAIRVGSVRVQEELKHLRKNGHKIFIFTGEDDKLMPGKELDVKVAGDSKSGPKGDNIKYNSTDAQVDQVIQLAGYHNTFRTTERADFDNNQWMSMIWVNALLEDLISR